MFQASLILPPAAIFALVNVQDKRVYIAYTSRLAATLGMIVTSVLDNKLGNDLMIRDARKLELVILETRLEKNFVKYFMDQYTKQGYQIYNGTSKIPLQYRFEMCYDGGSVVVVAANTRGEKTILGMFSKAKDAKSFLKYVKSNNPSNSLVYAL